MNVAYGLDSDVLRVPLGTENSWDLGSTATPKLNANTPRLPVESRLISISFTLESFRLLTDGSIWLQGVDSQQNRIRAVAVAPFCAAASAWARHIEGVHHALSASLRPDTLERVQRVKLQVSGLVFAGQSGEFVLQPVLRVQEAEQPLVPAPAPIASQPILALSLTSGQNVATPPLHPSSSATGGFRLGDSAPLPVPPPTIRAGLADIGVPSRSPVMALGTLFVLILVIMGLSLLVSVCLLWVGIRKSHWSVGEVLMDDDHRASLSRTIALLGAPVLLTGFLGFTIAGIAVILEGRSFPDTSMYLLAGGSLFLPYVANQGRAALERSRPPIVDRGKSAD